MKSQNGFTIVELLIVIVVIAVLAAITVTAYNGVQVRALDTAVKSDMKNFAKTYEIAAIDNGGVYPFPDTFTSAMGFKVSRSSYTLTRNNFYVCLDRNTNKYAFSAATTKDSFIGYTSDGTFSTLTTISADNNCALIGALRSTSGVGSDAAYNAGSTNSWDPWMN